MVLTIDDFLSMRATHPVVDVRSENEFAEGHMHYALSLPILNNEERRAVGIDYKQKGQLEAIRTGFRLVGPRFADMVDQARKIADGRELLVHCWRGGMRSANFCSIVGMAKVKTLQLEGGYKAYREKALQSYARPWRIYLVGGLTGSGKSLVLRELKNRGEQVVDLEALAHHRGSAFGGLMMPPQPTTEQFQNDLFEELFRFDTSRPLWVEDESIAIGKIFLPQVFWRQMSMAPLVDVSVNRDARVERLVNEYGSADRAEFLKAMKNISKKLGGQHFNAARDKLNEGDMASTIQILLNYYDKAYGAALKKKQDRVLESVQWDGRDIGACADRLIELSRQTSQHTS